MNKARTYSSSTIQAAMQKRDSGSTNRTRTSMLIAARIEDILQELNWRKKDLAEKLGKQPSEITRWLSGTHNFTINILADIETATGRKIIQVVERQTASRVITGRMTVHQKAARTTAAYVPVKASLKQPPRAETKAVKQRQSHA